MVMPTALQAPTILLVLAVLVANHTEGRHHQPDCPSFSFDPLNMISSPFRRAGDPPGCGDQSYEVVCKDTRATIHIDGATYYVSDINYSESTFMIIDTILDSYNSCPLPRWNPPHLHSYSSAYYGIKMVLNPAAADGIAIFVKCSHEVKNNGMYMSVACLSSNISFVYVLHVCRMPSRPFFCDEGHTHTEDSYHLTSELTVISEEDD